MFHCLATGTKNKITSLVTQKSIWWGLFKMSIKKHCEALFLLSETNHLSHLVFAKSEQGKI